MRDSRPGVWAFREMELELRGGVEGPLQLAADSPEVADSARAFLHGGVEAVRRAGAVDRWLASRLQQTIAPAGIRIELWDGTSPEFSGPHAGDLLIRDRGALIGLVVDPDLRFGEAYEAGRLAVRGDIGRVLESLSRLRAGSEPSLRERLALWCAPANGLLAARRNIHHHYDLGNDFYKLWLDPQLVYTCAYYPNPSVSLEAAQVAKLDLVCRKLHLQPGETVVDAGCGWGALAIHMARHYGVTVKAFNISREQLAFGRDRAEREGLTERVEFIDDDYRNVRGRFDAFVSIGMLEHVGRRNFESLARVLRRALKPDTGRGLLHFIGRDRPRPVNAWIRRRIFPGGYVPALSEVTRYILEPANLSVLDIDNLRLHYARTLRDWRDRFGQVEPTVRARFGDAFYRAWHLYLTGSEVAFTTGWLQLFQLVFAPSAGRTVHWTRAAVYDADSGAR
jgi:cyclopropane-fatty-acyl-phospholipid synthase